MDLRFLQRLVHVFLNSADKFGVTRAVHGRQRPDPRPASGTTGIRHWRRDVRAIDDGLLVPVQLAPVAHRLVPLHRNLREHVNPRADILGCAWCRAWTSPAMHWVQCRRRIKFFWWNCRGVNPNSSGSPAHIVERCQRIVAVKGRILDALRHHRPRQLLQAHHEQAALGPLCPGESLRVAQQQQRADCVEYRLVGCGIASSSLPRSPARCDAGPQDPAPACSSVTYVR